MKKRLVALLIVFTMVFSMAVPTFAAEGVKQDTLMLTGLGDSIASGCTNIDFVFDGGASAALDSDFRDFVTFTNGEKNYDCDAVSLSFVSKLYRALGANKYSMNLAFPGIRSKDFCNVVGIEPLKGDTYEDGHWETMSWACNMHILDNDYNAQQYNMAIKHSDVIVVELGMNDLTAALINNWDKIEAVFANLATLMPQGSQEQTVAEELADSAEDLSKEITDGGNPSRIESIVKKINQELGQLKNLGQSLEVIVKSLLEVLSDMTNQNRYYFKAMMNYIEENSKSGAVVVVTTMMNPFDGLTEGSDAAEFLGGAEVAKLMNLVIGPFIDATNLNIRSLAARYNYSVVDVSDVSINPGAPYMLHPDESGQQLICDKIYKTINRKLTKSRKAKLGVTVAVKGAKDATYFEKGYTGDEICAGCGEVLMRGSDIPILKPNSTKISKLSAAGKKMTVKWNKAKNVSGYQVQYSTSSKFSKNCKKLSATATSKTIKKLKSGSKYYVRVRTYKNVKNSEGQSVKVYSDWSAKKSIKVK